MSEIQGHPEGIRAGCRAMGVREGQYYYHRRRIAKEGVGDQSFREVLLPVASCPSEVEIRLRNGRSVFIRGEVVPKM